jgi:hypothetical protein
MATREQDQQRRARMRANGPVESFTVVEIGERDGWVCGVCLDPVRLVESPPELVKVDLEDLVFELVPPGEAVELDEGPVPRRPLSASIDHIVSIAAGGTHTRSNVQIAHLFCNLEKNSSSRKTGPMRPEYIRAKLSRLLEDTPVPEELHRSCFASWAYPARHQIEYMMALNIAGGEVAADPRYGDPGSRVERFAREVGQDRWLAAVANMRRRRAERDSRWGTACLRVDRPASCAMRYPTMANSLVVCSVLIPAPGAHKSGLCICIRAPTPRWAR